MEKRRIGSLEVSAVGLGCNNFGWRLDAEQTRAVVHAALDAGITFFDTADVYGGTRSEEFLGRAVAGRRDQVVIATKFGSRLDDQHRGARPEYVRQAAEASLRRLGTDRIDLYQLHWPDPDVAIEETLGLLHRDPERDVLPECIRLGLAFLPYFPLASGLLTGKYQRGQPAPKGTRISAGGWAEELLTDQNLAVVEALEEFVTSRRHTLLELAISWLLAQPAVAPVIAGATSPGQVKANAAAAGWRLTQEELAEIDGIATAPNSRVRRS